MSLRVCVRVNLWMYFIVKTTFFFLSYCKKALPYPIEACLVPEKVYQLCINYTPTLCGDVWLN